MNQDENMKDSKYEEALERAKQGLPIDEIFPELKESEDERNRKQIVGFIRWAIDRGSITNEQRERSDSWLAYLERQKDKVVEFDHDREQKPEERSEEEMRKIVELKYFITQCNGFNKENRKKAFDMIDSLRPRPHWKPSVEQMNALKVVAHGYKSDDLNAIESLLNDLQKLL